MNTYYISNTERSNFRKVELTLPTRIYGSNNQTSKEEKWVDYISLLRFPVYLPAQDVLIEFQMEEGSANGMTFISNIAACCLDGIKLVSHLAEKFIPK
ncbi:uncharacterized protein LOC115223421 isoform X3 [Octopus sinensis]|uniref:Uncharacterized protein LOC115223421 isoform X3 n=1 Tax=Octopus sinensis TaxID=2607531 RepID=A0A7E6FMT7_9MOLL|nr:uncharacterized protein LOC115223421 isoform X3 [Octopus sinensis]